MRAAWAWSVSMLLALIAVTAVTIAGGLASLDHAVLDAVDGVHVRGLEVASSLLALTAGSLASGVWAVVAAAIAWRVPALRRPALAVIAALVAGSVVELLLKVAVDYPGPHATRTPGLLVGGPVIATRGSFPSGHMLRALVLAAGAATLARSWVRPLRLAWWVGLVGYCLAIAWTRIYLEDHWLSDTIAGALLGAAAVPWILAGWSHRNPAAGPGR